MVQYFPALLPDELLYSACARFHAHLRIPSHRKTALRLFGDNALAVIDLPGNIEALISAFPLGHGYNADQLIDQHTLLPLYQPFLPPARALRLRADMKGPNGKAVHLRAGIMASRVRQPEFLRFCPMCDDENMAGFGETYWNRLFQLAGIEVCPRHAVFLEQSQIRWAHRQTRHAFIAHTPSARTHSLRPLDEQNRDYSILVRLARSGNWLLSTPSAYIDSVRVQQGYLELLASQTFATYTGTVRVRELVRAVRERYSPDFLKLIHCELTSDHDNWIARLLRQPRCVQAPIRHLLLMDFLGIDAAQFFSEHLVNRSAFGVAPFPCLNPIVHEGRAIAIGDGDIRLRQECDRVVGEFRCQVCGYTYCRTGPDPTGAERQRTDWVSDYGSLWRQRLIARWNDPEISLRGIARELGADPLTIKRHAQQLALQFPRIAARATNRPAVPARAATIKLPDAFGQHSHQWASTIEKNPLLGTKAIRRLVPATYAWLYRHHPTWLREHTPKRRPQQIPKCSVDWTHRDRMLAQATRTAAHSLYNSLGKPTRVTLPMLGRKIRALALLQKHLMKLPQTAEVLGVVIESRESFAVRRILRVTNQVLLEKRPIAEWQLIRQSGLRPDMLASQRVRSTIEECMGRVRSLTQGHP